MLQLHATRTAIIEIPILLLFVAPTHGQSDLKEKRVIQFAIQNTSLPQAAIQLAFKLQVPIGVETLPGTERKIDFSTEGSTLGAALDALVQKNPLYQWKERGGVIDIFPSNQRQSVFDVVIHEFSVENLSSLQIVQELLKTKQVSDYLKANQVSAGIWMVGSVQPYKKGSLTLRSETLREALNDALTNTQSHAWTSYSDPRSPVKHLWFQAW